MNDNVKLNQERFNSYYYDWIRAKNNHDVDYMLECWQVMFNCVLFACQNICKSKAYGIRIDDLDGKALDAACKIMEKIINDAETLGKCPTLSSFCYLYCIGQLWNKKNQRWDKSVSYEGYFDNYAYNECSEANVLSICKENF